MDCMEILYELKDLLCEELDKINKKHDINPGELEMAYKAVDIIKDISTIEAMEEYGDEYSYDDDMSYARNRDSMGRYSSRRGRRSYDGGNYSNRRSYNDHMMPMDRGYSGAESKEEMMRKIDDMQRKLQQM